MLGKPAVVNDRFNVFEVLAREYHCAGRAASGQHAISSHQRQVFLSVIFPGFLQLRHQSGVFELGMRKLILDFQTSIFVELNLI